jgi:hypothetical protein
MESERVRYLEGKPEGVRDIDDSCGKDGWYKGGICSSDKRIVRKGVEIDSIY